MITSVTVESESSGALLSPTINQSNSNEGDKSCDDPIELLRSLSDETKTDGSVKSDDNINTDKGTPDSSTTTTVINTTPKYSNQTPPPSGTSSKSVPKKQNVAIEKMFETFYQSPSGEFKPTFYNPFEVRHRRRTSRSQFKILERAFMENCKPSAVVRKALAQELNMSARSIQVWFQNRRAKLKSMLKNGKMTDLQMMEYLNQQQKEQKEDLDEVDQDQECQDSPSSFEDSEGSEPENNNPSHQQQQSQQEKIGKMTKVFTTTEQRTFPNGSKSIPIDCINVRESEMMSFGNSYPNQSRTRSYSLPTIQRSPQLPFKQLQEALFGSSNSSTPPESQIIGQAQSQGYNVYSACSHSPGYLHNNGGYSQLHPQQMSLNSQPYYNTSLNAFQHYYRASNAVMSQVSSNHTQNLPSHGSYYDSQGQQIQVHFTPLDQAIEVEYQVDPNRFRPRSSSFAIGQRTTQPGSSYDLLSTIKEDSPISEYMSIPQNAYFDGNDQDSAEVTNQIHSMDLDYFMSANGNDGYNHPSSIPSSSYYSSSNPSSVMASSQNSPNINDSNNNVTGGNNSHYMNELAFLPQPTNEILLSTLIDDEHFLQ